MEEILLAILEEFRELNIKVSEIESQLQDIKGVGLYTSLSDICDKLDEVKGEVDSIKGPMSYDLTDLHNTLSSIDVNTYNP